MAGSHHDSAGHVGVGDAGLHAYKFVCVYTREMKTERRKIITLREHRERLSSLEREVLIRNNKKKKESSRGKLTMIETEELNFIIDQNITKAIVIISKLNDNNEGEYT